MSWDVNWDQDPFLIHLTFKQVQLLVRENPLKKERGAIYKELIITNYDPRPRGSYCKR